MSSNSSSSSSSSGSIQMDLPPLATVLDEEERKDDCSACRAIGSAAFVGLGAYTFLSGRAQLRQLERERTVALAATRWGVGARRLGVYGIAAGLVGLGVYRAVM